MFRRNSHHNNNVNKVVQIFLFVRRKKGSNNLSYSMMFFLNGFLQASKAASEAAKMESPLESSFLHRNFDELTPSSEHSS